jgi:hypothetical protein
LIEGDKCIFFPSYVSKDMQIVDLSKCLIVKKVDQLFFKQRDIMKIGGLLKVEDDNESDDDGYHSCEGEPIVAVASTTLAAKTPAMPQTIAKSKSSKQTSGTYKTPRFEVNAVQPSISAGDKVQPAHSIVGFKRDDRDESASEEEDNAATDGQQSGESNDSFAASPAKQKTDELRVSPPFTPPKDPKYLNAE